MFSPTTSLTLFSLLALFILSNIAAILFGQPSPDRTRRAIPWLQRSTSLQLAIMAWLFWVLAARGTALATFALLIAFGMSISFVADLIMAEIIRLPNRVLGGIVVFGLAHLTYIAAYVAGGQALGILRAPLWGGAVAGFLALGLVLWRALIHNPAAPQLLNYGALGYTLLITVMVSTAVALSLADGRLGLLSVGAFLFLISDVILGNQIFRQNNWPYVSEVVWLTYILGQAGIVWSVLPALTIL
ncbi:MAG: lysoplasmalogenase [Chloroflexi bacterium]|nr:lysoplasmalogenase [Chloroflexota bacterium]